MKEAGAENLSFEFLNRGVDQPYKYVGTWLVDEWSKIGCKRGSGCCRPARCWMRSGAGISRLLWAPIATACPNPLIDVQAYLPSSIYAANYGYYEDPAEVDTLQQDAARD